MRACVVATVTLLLLPQLLGQLPRLRLHGSGRLPGGGAGAVGAAEG